MLEIWRNFQQFQTAHTCGTNAKNYNPRKRSNF